MDDCTDILIPSDNRAKILNISTNSYSNIVYLSAHKNPFDRQFELALKNGITPNLSSSSNSFNPSSPLNTPLIPPDSAFNSAAVPDLSINDSSPAITTAQITNLILESEIAKDLNDHDNTTNDNNIDAINVPTNEDRINKDNNVVIDGNTIGVNGNNNGKIKHRSNVVSVICPPVPTLRDECSVRSAPVILESANCNGPCLEKPEAIMKDKTSFNPFGNNVLPTTNITNITSNVQRPSNTINIINKEICAVSSTSESQPLNVNYTFQESRSTLKKILPKYGPAINSSTPDEIAQRLSSLPPARRKEKTLDELINKIKATEAALPPKAKPGRKSKQSTEEDAKEKKRLSLERNRAAAMRCRLKKKKEIDELKHRVENYEQQNQHLKKIIDSLYNEVAFLKNELMRHKDCN